MRSGLGRQISGSIQLPVGHCPHPMIQSGDRKVTDLRSKSTDPMNRYWVHVPSQKELHAALAWLDEDGPASYCG